MKVLRILIVCERSGQVRRAFRALGHDAWSCDLEPADDDSPHHFQCDALDAIASGHWDLVIMHPECTYLSVSGIHWNNRGRGWERTDEALEFVRRLMETDVPWCLENPISIISSRIRKPDQIIQPYNFGADASKKTCLWLNGLPPLTNGVFVPPRMVCPCCGGTQPWGTSTDEKDQQVCCNLECDCEKPMTPRWSNQTDSGQNKLGPSETRKKDRSETYPGIAQAMAEQWSHFLLNK